MPSRPHLRPRAATVPDRPIAPGTPLYRLLQQVARAIAASLDGQSPESGASPAPSERSSGRPE